MLTLSLWTLILNTVVSLYRNSKRRYSFPLPPGPTSIPVIGNLLSAPTRTPWVTYAEWSRKYNSELVSFTIFGQVYVVVNSLRAAKELFESRSAMYSDRPYLTMVDISAASLTMDMAYGHELAPKNDPFVELVEKAMVSFAEVTVPGAAVLVNTFPFPVRHLPSWLPGMGFKMSAEKCHKTISDMLNVPWEAVERQVADGTARPSLASSWIVEHRHSHPGDDAERIAKDACGVLYVGSRGRYGKQFRLNDVLFFRNRAFNGQTVTSLMNAVRALALNPSVQIEAQAEIDSIIDRSCLPAFDDRSSLPYVGAIVREVMRRHQGFPLSVVRVVEKDDVYMGMTIPKGAHIMPNLWAMSNDSGVYAEPDTFRPERFLTNEGRLNNDTSRTLFGFGRRNCPGQHLAEATIWITVVSILAVYTISKAKDKDGNEIPIEITVTDGGISYPGPFQISIKPRDAAAEALLKSLRGNPA
ncbi:hypothetical protein EWM64_g4748 [Hericium alpestre]|uniref:Cytochrome P450 n=1 Tax=Hericium alpestre TaxID=135208 RepID=A0A4Y9ZYJ1_9AGAM|nr:hypothetical protein EWM64_g4748 [Hericium alpestre]